MIRAIQRQVIEPGSQRRRRLVRQSSALHSLCRFPNTGWEEFQKPLLLYTLIYFNIFYYILFRRPPLNYQSFSMFHLNVSSKVSPQCLVSMFHLTVSPKCFISMFCLETAFCGASWHLAATSQAITIPHHSMSYPGPEARVARPYVRTEHGRP